jgi:hypothetical protein
MSRVVNRPVDEWIFAEAADFRQNTIVASVC